MNNYPDVTDQPREHALAILDSQEYMTISTATMKGQPWVSPVFYAHDDSYNLYWVSSKESRHSRLIRNNPRIAIVIYDATVEAGEGGAVYVEAGAQELSINDDLDHAIQVYNNKPQDDEFQISSVDDITDEAPWRMYKATPQKTYVLGEPEYVDGQYVSRRVEVTL